VKLEKIQPGMTLHSYGRDGTIMRKRCSWPVRVLEVDLAKRMVLASWNNNPAKWMPERIATKCRHERAAALGCDSRRTG
jgi:hypothetical protein